MSSGPSWPAVLEGAARCPPPLALQFPEVGGGGWQERSIGQWFHPIGRRWATVRKMFGWLAAAASAGGVTMTTLEKWPSSLPPLCWESGGYIRIEQDSMYPKLPSAPPPFPHLLGFPPVSPALVQRCNLCSWAVLL